MKEKNIIKREIVTTLRNIAGIQKWKLKRDWSVREVLASSSVDESVVLILSGTQFLGVIYCETAGIAYKCEEDTSTWKVGEDELQFVVLGEGASVSLSILHDNSRAGLIGRTLISDGSQKFSPLSSDQFDAISISLNPSAINPFATIKDATAQPATEFVVNAQASTSTTDFAAPDSNLTFLFKELGAVGNELVINLIDPEEESVELSFTYVGNDLDIILATDETGAIITTANDILVLLSVEDSPVLVLVEGTGLGFVEEAALIALEGGVDATAGNVGSFLVDEFFLYVKISDFAWRKVALTDVEDGD
jgi:hypothetical protein